MTWRNRAIPHDTEEKTYWYQHGCQEEADFCTLIAPQAALQVKVNPRKAHDPKVIDLIRTLPDGTQRYADLKTQRTPFFTAGKYGKDPALTVTFNLKDLAYYERRYPQADILFHVDWQQTALHLRSQLIRVPYVHGVWLTSVPGIRELVSGSKAPVHAYQRRVSDQAGNARDSYLISLTDLTELIRFR